MAGIRGREGGFPPRDEHPRDKAMRSIFVANIAFETTEEQLRTVLSEVGPVVNLKLIYDPATGKPRGFGFCEYKDPQTASSAVRNLAGREVNGRPLRIDSATNAPGGEGSKGGPSPPVGGGQPEPRTYGPSVPPESAPEVITKAVASLPPEQMFELMKQMKWFISQNPQEARQLLLHNPQLAYALLQAQVVMKIVDLETAQSLLHRNQRGPPLSQSSPGPPSSQAHHPPPQQHHPPPQQHIPPPQEPHPHHPPQHGGLFHGPPPPRDMPPRGLYGGPRPPPQEHYGHPMRGHPPEPRGEHFGGPPPPRGPPTRPPLHERPPPPPKQDDSQDQQKAALIMQVLSLSDDQIQMLPPEQRASILKLKEQIARNGP